MQINISAEIKVDTASYKLDLKAGKDFAFLVDQTKDGAKDPVHVINVQMKDGKPSISVAPPNELMGSAPVSNLSFELS